MVWAQKGLGYHGFASAERDYQARLNSVRLLSVTGTLAHDVILCSPPVRRKVVPLKLNDLAGSRTFSARARTLSSSCTFTSTGRAHFSPGARHRLFSSSGMVTHHCDSGFHSTDLASPTEAFSKSGPFVRNWYRSASAHNLRTLTTSHYPNRYTSGGATSEKSGGSDAVSRTSSLASLEDGTESEVSDPEDYKKLYENVLSENKRLIQELKDMQEANQKLKDENGALIRVISKLSK